MIPGERQAAGQYISGNAGKSGNRNPTKLRASSLRLLRFLRF
jgi:hypothetical protein